MIHDKSALIVIDVQNDFCPGGALAVEGGDRIIPAINSKMHSFYRVIGTQDWHPGNHVSFASHHAGKKPFDRIKIGGLEQTLWPDHCVAGSIGAEFHRNLDTVKFHLIIRKGINQSVDSYSAFMENDKKSITGLEGYLKALRISDLYLCGLATDYCVYFSAMDARRLGFKTRVIQDACRGIDQPAGSLDSIIRDMKNSGIEIIDSGDLRDE